GNPPTATPSATGTTRTRAAVATVMSDRNGSRTAVDSARPASVTIQPATRRRLRLPMSTTEAYGRSGPPTRSRQDRVRNVPPRITAARARASSWPPSTRPELDGNGRLLRGSRWVALSPTEEQLCALMIGEFGQVVSDRALIAQAWPEGTGTPTGLRLQMTRLR